MVDKIITEAINGYLESREMLKEYKNPEDSETVRVCADQLENLYNRIISTGMSRHEFSIEKLRKAILDLRKIQKLFSGL